MAADNGNRYVDDRKSGQMSGEIAGFPAPAGKNPCG
jgi:hypothetical protein